MWRRGGAGGGGDIPPFHPLYETVHTMKNDCYVKWYKKQSVLPSPLSGFDAIIATIVVLDTRNNQRICSISLGGLYHNQCFQNASDAIWDKVSTIVFLQFMFLRGRSVYNININL